MNTFNIITSEAWVYGVKEICEMYIEVIEARNREDIMLIGCQNIQRKCSI